MRVLTRSGSAPATYQRSASAFRTPARSLSISAAVLLVAVLPQLLSPTNLGIANLASIAIVGAVALNMLTGMAGQVSLGQAAFLAIGAYTAVFTTVTLHANMFVGVPLAGISSAVVGMIIGVPSLRFRGFYLALTTLGLHFIALYVLQKYQVHAGGLAGFVLPVQHIGSRELLDDSDWYYPLALCAVIAIVFSFNVSRSRVGRAWVAVRDRDVAAAIIGVNVTRYKLLAFATSSFFAGCAGALAAYYRGNVSIESFSLDVAIAYVAMIIVGGLGSTAGAVMGAILITGLPFWLGNLVNSLPPGWPVVSHLALSIYALQSAAFGVVIVIFLIYEPRGLIAVWARVKTWLLLWPFQRAESEE